MDNKVNEGLTLQYTASADISAGDLVHVGNGLAGVAVDDITSGDTGVIAIRGRFTVLKSAATAMAAGKLLKIGTAGNTVTLATAGTSAENLISARVVKASTTAETTVDVVFGL